MLTMFLDFGPELSRTLFQNQHQNMSRCVARKVSVATNTEGREEFSTGNSLVSLNTQVELSCEFKNMLVAFFLISTQCLHCSLIFVAGL